MTDPLARLRHDERWAGHVVAAATGAEALPHDVGGAQSAVDITLRYPDGRTGALEVTSHAADWAKQRDAILADTDHKWPNPGRWGWGIRVGPAVRLNDLRERYGRIITTCERHAVTSPELIPWDVQAGEPDQRWLIDHPEVSIVGTTDLADPDHPPPTYVMPDLEGRFIDEALDGLNAAVEDLLAVPPIAGHIPKLLAHPADVVTVKASPNPQGAAPRRWILCMYVRRRDRGIAAPSQRAPVPRSLRLGVDGKTSGAPPACLRGSEGWRAPSSVTRERTTLGPREAPHQGLESLWGYGRVRDLDPVGCAQAREAQRNPADNVDDGGPISHQRVNHERGRCLFALPASAAPSESSSRRA